MFLHPILLSAAVAIVAEGADERYEFILGLSRKGMHEMVVREAGDFLEDYPDHERADHARYCLANAQFETGQHARAGEHYQRLAGDRGGFEFAAECAFRWGRCELEQGRLEPARDAFRRALDSGRDYLAAPSHYYLAEALFRGEDFAEAEAHYEEARRLDAETFGADAEYGLVWCAFRLRDHDQVVRRAERFQDGASPDRQQEYAFLCGEAKLELGDARGALASYGRVRGGEYHDDALRGAGFAAAELGRHGDAVRWFAQLVETYPQSPLAEEANLHRGVHLFQGGEHARAEEVLSSPGLRGVPEAALWCARAQRALGRADDALGTLEGIRGDALDGETGDQVRSLRGEILLALGRSDEAAEAFGQAGSLYALHAAAIAELHAGRFREAEGLARRLLATDGDSTYRGPAQLTLAEALFEQERYGEAGAEFEAAAKLDPSDGNRARCRSRMGWCAYFTEAFDEAHAHFARLAREHPAAEEAEEAQFMAMRSAEQGERVADAVQAGRAYLSGYREGEHRPEVYLALARLDGEHRGAWLERLVDEQPAAPFLVQAHLALGEERSAAGDHPAAGEQFRRVLELGADGSSQRRAAYGLAWSEYHAGELDLAAQHLAQVVNGEEADEDLRRAALELLLWTESAAGRTDRARAAYRAFAPLCTDEQRRFDAANVVCRALGKAGEFEAAEGVWSDLMETVEGPRVAVAICVEQAFVALEMGRPEIADAHARAAHEFAPEDPALAEALFFVGEGYFDQGELERAIETYALASIPASPTACQALYKSGFALLQLERPAPAEQAFARLLEEHSACELAGESRFLLGEARYRQGDWNGAVEALEPMYTLANGQVGLRDHASRPKALFRLGLAHGELGQWEPCARVLAELVRKHPDFEHGMEAELWRGRALCRAGDERGGRAALARVLDGDQGVFGARARLELGKLASDAGDPDGALSEFLKVAVLYAYEDEVSEALYLAGGVLEQQGQGENARKQYEELIERFAQSRFAEPARQRLRALAQR